MYCLESIAGDLKDSLDRVLQENYWYTSSNGFTGFKKPPNYYRLHATVRPGFYDEMYSVEDIYWDDIFRW
jgi:hypothetical protein